MEKSKVPCFHCGDVCPKNPITLEDKPFCCNGCKTVYELLSDHQLDNYYRLEDSPGVKPFDEIQGQYNYLDKEEIAAKLYDFNEGKIKKIRIFLPDIHCSSCIYLLENLNRLHTGVKQSEVNFIRKVAQITFDNEQISLKELAELLDRIGYPPKFETQNTDEERNKRSRSFLLKLGITFFCFSNIMLFSFPEYLNADASFTDGFRTTFSYLVLAFSIPILLYSARDYFVSAYKALRAKSINLDVPISLGIAALYLKSVYEISIGNGPGYMDSFAGFVFFLLLGKWFQNKTYEALSFERDYLSYFPMAVTVLEDDKEVITEIEKLEKGDRVLIRNKEIIPADSILMKSEVKIDYSFVTGESELISKKEGEQIFAGGRLDGTMAEMTIIKPVENSYLTQLWNQKSNGADHKESTLKKRTDRISHFFIIAVLLIATLTGLIWVFIDSSRSLEVVTAVLIVACPCALALSIPFTFGNAIRTASRNQWYLKNSDTIEKLGNITDVVFDKTGTITENNASEIVYEGTVLTERVKYNIYLGVRNSNHPLSKALAEHLSDLVDDMPSSTEITKYEEIESKGLKFISDNQQFLIGSSVFTGHQESEMPGSKVYLSIDGTPHGFFRFKNKYRPSFLDVIEQLGLKYQLHLLSGDNDQEKEFLIKYFPVDDQIRFYQKPIDKLEYVKKLKEEGRSVLMVGDGLNDAGALLESQVGIAVSEGVYSFSPACDGIVKASKLRLLPGLLDLGKYSHKVLRAAYIFSIVYNVTGLYFAVQGMLTPLIAAILMPLSSISIVLLTTLSMSAFEKRVLKN